MNFVLYFLLIFNFESQAYSSSDLKEMLSCEIGTDVPIKKQSALTKYLLNVETLRELERQKFKHLSQYKLFLEEMIQLNGIKIAAGKSRLSEETRALFTLNLFIDFMKEEGFLNPVSVCQCAQAIGQSKVDKKPEVSSKNLEHAQIHEWFASCIKKQFVPTMYNNPELEDKYN